MPARPPLSRERIIEAATRVADAGGLGRVSMRGVAAELGCEAMSLYHHLTGKDDLLDGLADWVFTQIRLPSPGEGWRHAMACRAESARLVLSAHPWALGLIESRRDPGPNLLRHHDAVLGCLRADGFSVALAGHAFSVLDSYVYGFVLTELNLPFTPEEGAAGFVAELTLPLQDYPHLVEMVATQVSGGNYAYGEEFGFGLDLILQALQGRLEQEDTADERAP